jgi:hypothetical protein
MEIGVDTTMVEVGPGYRALPHQSLAPRLTNDGYAGPIQAGPSFMQAIEDPRPQFVRRELSVVGYRKVILLTAANNC